MFIDYTAAQHFVFLPIIFTGAMKFNPGTVMKSIDIIECNQCSIETLFPFIRPCYRLEMIL